MLFADRMIIESCIGSDQRSLYVSGAFGGEPELPQLLTDVLDRNILVVDESPLPAAMCNEVLDGHVIDAPAVRRVRPRAEWRETVAERWHEFRRTWSTVTGVPPLGTLDDALAANMPS